jgi:hypothetical protein
MSVIIFCFYKGIGLLFYLMKYTIQQLLNKEVGTVFGSVNRNDINGLKVDISDEDVQTKKLYFKTNS